MRQGTHLCHKTKRTRIKHQNKHVHAETETKQISTIQWRQVRGRLVSAGQVSTDMPREAPWTFVSVVCAGTCTAQLPTVDRSRTGYQGIHAPGPATQVASEIVYLRWYSSANSKHYKKKNAFMGGRFPCLKSNQRSWHAPLSVPWSRYQGEPSDCVFKQ